MTFWVVLFFRVSFIRTLPLLLIWEGAMTFWMNSLSSISLNSLNSSLLTQMWSVVSVSTYQLNWWVMRACLTKLIATSWKSFSFFCFFLSSFFFSDFLSLLKGFFSECNYQQLSSEWMSLSQKEHFSSDSFSHSAFKHLFFLFWSFFLVIIVILFMNPSSHFSSTSFVINLFSESSK